ncbi:MAG TPA: phage portal protein, partial [Schlesneria sp.]
MHTATTPHGRPIDYFELEQHRLHNLANSMTLAIAEGFGDYVDTREWQQDDPSFGFGRVGSPILYTSLNDRDDGKYMPIYQTQMDLAAIRAEARNVTAMSGGVMGAIGTLSNYTLGGGLKFTAQRAATCPKNIKPETVQLFIAEAQTVIDRFLHENKFQSDMDREIDSRSREDGEAFVELSVSPAGQIRASFDEPDMVCQPGNPDPIEDWLRDQDASRYSPDWIWSWSFGVHCIRRTPDDPLGYHVVYDTSGEDWEYIPASRMLHVKRNVPRNVKRGVSDLYWIANDVQREAKIRRNTADGAALQAAIAWFREHAQGTTTSAVQSMVDGQAVDTRQQRTSSGTRPTKQGKLRSGTVVDIPETMRVLPGPMGSERNANFLLIAQYVARAIAQRWAMPEFMFTSDASNANYASTLVAESPFVKAREADQRFYCQAFAELLWKVLRLAHEIGRAFQGMERFSDLQQILEITATGPRVSNRDEMQTVQRQQIEIGMGTLSLETAAAEMGRDLAKEKAKGARPQG